MILLHSGYFGGIFLEYKGEGGGDKGLTSRMQITTHRREEGQGRRLKEGGLPRMKVA